MLWVERTSDPHLTSPYKGEEFRHSSRRSLIARVSRPSAHTDRSVAFGVAFHKTLPGYSESTRSGAPQVPGVNMSKSPESVPPERPAQSARDCAAGSANPGTARQGKCQQTGERWFLLARHAAIVDRYAYSSFCVGSARAVLEKCFRCFAFGKSSMTPSIGHPPGRILPD